MTTLRKVLVDHALEVGLVGDAHDLVDHAAALEEHHRGNAADLILNRHVLILVDVELAHAHAAGVFRRQGVDRRTERTAGAAPLRPEVDEHRRIRLEHVRVEVAVRKRHDLV